MPATILGLPQLQKNLAKVLDEVQTRITIDGLTLGAEMMQGAISMRAPRLTGQLAGDIVIQFKFKSGVGVALVGPSEDSFYGKFLEYGTKFVAARPFMRPALDEHGRGIIAAMAAYTERQFARMRVS